MDIVTNFSQLQGVLLRFRTCYWWLELLQKQGFGWG